MNNKDSTGCRVGCMYLDMLYIARRNIGVLDNTQTHHICHCHFYNG